MTPTEVNDVKQSEPQTQTVIKTEGLFVYLFFSLFFLLSPNQGTLKGRSCWFSLKTFG